MAPPPIGCDPSGSQIMVQFFRDVVIRCDERLSKRQEKGREVCQIDMRINPPFLPAIFGNYHSRPLYPPTESISIIPHHEKQSKKSRVSLRILFL
jgi:hypothetical protein